LRQPLEEGCFGAHMAGAHFSIVGLDLYPGSRDGPRLDFHTWHESLLHTHELATSMRAACVVQ
jgi:hypothetical protein